MVVNIVDVGWATSKSGCLPISVSTVPTGRLSCMCEVSFCEVATTLTNEPLVEQDCQAVHSSSVLPRTYPATPIHSIQLHTILFWLGCPFYTVVLTNQNECYYEVCSM
jgi:hypothetical protein